MDDHTYGVTLTAERFLLNAQHRISVTGGGFDTKMWLSVDV